MLTAQFSLYRMTSGLPLPSISSRAIPESYGDALWIKPHMAGCGSVWGCEAINHKTFDGAVGDMNNRQEPYINLGALARTIH